MIQLYLAAPSLQTGNLGQEWSGNVLTMVLTMGTTDSYPPGIKHGNSSEISSWSKGDQNQTGRLGGQQD